MKTDTIDNMENKRNNIRILHAPVKVVYPKSTVLRIQDKYGNIYPYYNTSQNVIVNLARNTDYMITVINWKK